MAYKFGTYRISLGLDKAIREMLEKIIGVAGLSLADSVRECIKIGYQHYCVSVSPAVAIKELQTLRKDLQDTLSCLRS